MMACAGSSSRVSSRSSGLGEACADAAVTTYGYDEVDNLTSRTDANQHVTARGYDLAGRLTSTTSPTEQRWNYTHDAAGNWTNTETAVGTATGTAGDGTIRYSYDVLDRQSRDST